MGNPPVGTVTFLFSDLVGSTHLWDEHPEVMGGALARHDALLRAAVAAHGGTIVKSTGDGAMAAFGSVPEAVLAAVESQRGFAAEEWPAEAQLASRMGLHTGVAEYREGDYYGTAVNRAQRIMAIGHGGQILVSDAAAAVIAEERTAGLRDLGEHRLRDLSRPEHVHQVVADGLADDFPPLRSLDALPTNLPVQLTSFVGREVEIDRVTAAVQEHRLVTLVGVGGVGKTRLALQVAGGLVADLPDGAWVSELAPATDEDAMLATVVATFRVQPRTGMSLEESVAEALRTRTLLWVIDNCEHLVGAVARLADRVLRTAPGVRILATSREGLDVDGEHLVTLRSLRVAASDDLAVIVQTDAVRLFVDRAAAVRDGFVLDAANVATCNEICRRLDGIPLAIELAASRVASMAPARILALLDERYRLLTGGRRVALERHQTLRAAIDWSYSLLTEAERSVFARLAVFAGTFDGESAATVVGDDAVDEWAVVDALDGLVRKSMLALDERPDGSVRYQLLETLRQYAREILDEHGETDHWRARHAAHYAALAEEIGAGLWGRDEFAWRDRLRLEIDNIRVAAQWAADAGDAAVLRAIVVALSEEVFKSMASEGFGTAALPLADRLDDETRETVLALAAYEAYQRGDPVLARHLWTEAWDRLDSGGPSLVTVLRLRRFMPGMATAEQIRAGSRIVRDWDDGLVPPDASPVERAWIYSLVGMVGIQGGELEGAKVFADRAYALAREVGNPSTLAQALYEVGAVHLVDDPDAALRAFDESIALSEQGGLFAGHAAALFQGALLLARRGELDAATARMVDAIEMMRPRGRNVELDGACGYAVELFLLLGRPEDAAIVLGSLLDGELRTLREFPMPPDRSATNLRALRDEIGRDRFAELLALGARLGYDEILDHIVGALQDRP